MMGPYRSLPEWCADLAVGETWARIDAWLAARFPQYVERFEGPASENEIAAVERELGVALPEDYRASLRVHAGGRTMPTKSGKDVFGQSPFEGLTLLAPLVSTAPAP